MLFCFASNEMCGIKISFDENLKGEGMVDINKLAIDTVICSFSIASKLLTKNLYIDVNKKLYFCLCTVQCTYFVNIN
jgi:hypothetical protein